MPFSTDPRIAAIEYKRNTLLSQNSNVSDRFKRARSGVQFLAYRLSGASLTSDQLSELRANYQYWTANAALRATANSFISDPTKTADDLVYPDLLDINAPSIYEGSDVPFVTNDELATLAEKLVLHPFSIEVAPTARRTGHLTLTTPSGLSNFTTVQVRQSATPGTGKGFQSSGEFDQILMSGKIVSDTTIECSWVAPTGPIIGNFNFHYQLN